jgi:hypothetical protein
MLDISPKSYIFWQICKIFRHNCISFEQAIDWQSKPLRGTRFGEHSNRNHWRAVLGPEEIVGEHGPIQSCYYPSGFNGLCLLVCSGPLINLPFTLANLPTIWSWLDHCHLSQNITPKAINNVSFISIKKNYLENKWK